MNNNIFLKSYIEKIDIILDITRQTTARDEIVQLLMQSLLLNIESEILTDKKISDKLPSYDVDDREKIIELLETMVEENSGVVVKATNTTLTDFINRIDTLSDDAKKQLIEKVLI